MKYVNVQNKIGHQSIYLQLSTVKVVASGICFQIYNFSISMPILNMENNKHPQTCT